MAVTDTTTKQCTKCGEVKPTTEFVNDSGKRDGLYSSCKSCNKSRKAAWNAENADKVKERNACWRAANADKVKSDKAAYYEANKEKVKAAALAWQKANPDKVNAKNAKWKASNRDKVKASGAAYYAANPEAIRIRNHNRRARYRAVGGKLSKGLAEKLFKLQKGKCACCGRPLGDDYHLDHIMPLALGGTNTDNNTQLLRATCNQQKHAKHPVDFMRQRGFLL